MTSNETTSLESAFVILAHVLDHGRLVDRVTTLELLRVALVAVDVASRQPVLAAPGLEALVLVHDIDLLESKRLGLVEEEVGHDTGCQVGAEEHETEAIADAIGCVGSEETDHEVGCMAC